MVWILFIFLSVAAVAIHRQRRAILALTYELGNREREKNAVFDFLNRTGERITTSLDVTGTLQLVVEFLQDATKADAAAIFLRQPDEPDVLRAPVVLGFFPPLHRTTTERLLAKRKFLAERARHDTIRIGEGIVGRVAELGKGMLITDAERDERVPREASEVIPIKDLILAPIKIRGETLGVLVLVNKREDGPFSESDMSLVTAIADQAAVMLDLVRLYDEFTAKQRVEQQLQVAKEFQQMLLPRELPRIETIEVAGFSQPALEVGGDYYDFIDVDEHHLGVVIADVSGKGVPGALVMASVRASLRAEARGNLSPREVLRATNAQAVKDTKRGVFITATYGVLDKRTGVFRFARAGHDPLVVVRPEDGELTLHEPNGIALGLMEGEVFDLLEESEVSLKDDGAIVLYTDGVVEAMDEQKRLYGDARLHEVLKNTAGEPPQAVIEAINLDIEAFAGVREPHDDITIVVLQWRRPAAQDAAVEPESTGGAEPLETPATDTGT